MNFKLSTSFFNINADHGLSKCQMRAYKLSNLLNNSFPNSFLDKELKIKKFLLDSQTLEKFWPEIEPTSSPSRALSNLFWFSLPWKKSKAELGEINVFDTGCGSGNYGKFLIEKANTTISSYTGTDFKENSNWKNLEKNFFNFHFFCSDNANILSCIPKKTNLFISQSAIEHFSKDLLYFKQIRKFIINTNRPIFQIHLFPSAACLHLYRFHGIRQYTPRTISKITRLFPNSTKKLFFLGGSACNLLHYNFITKQKNKGLSDLRLSDTKKYINLLKEKITEDINLKNLNQPSFYALIIHSNINQKTF